MENFLQMISDDIHVFFPVSEYLNKIQYQIPDKTRRKGQDIF